MKERYGLGVLKGLRAMMQREIMLTRRNRCFVWTYCIIVL